MITEGFVQKHLKNGLLTSTFQPPQRKFGSAAYEYDIRVNIKIQTTPNMLGDNTGRSPKCLTYLTAVLGIKLHTNIILQNLKSLH